MSVRFTLESAFDSAQNMQWVLAQRQEVLNQAYEHNPQRFVRKPPRVERFQEEVWINPPEKTLDI